MRNQAFFQFLLISINYNHADFHKCYRIVKGRYLGPCDEGVRSLACLNILNSFTKNIRVPYFSYISVGGVSLFFFPFSFFPHFLSNTCEELKFRGWYDAAFRLGQETHQILFEF